MSLELENERFRLAVANSTIVLLEAALDGAATWIYNSQLGRIVGNTMGRRLNELMTPEAAAAYDSFRAEVLATGERRSFETALDLDGVRLHLWLNLGPRYDASGAIVGFIGSAIDITDRIEYRDRMLGILGHDLRNPLAAIQGVVGLLGLDANLSDRTRKGLEQVDKAAHRMNEMIQTVLDFTRARFHGELPVARTPMSLHELCQATIDDVQAAVPSATIRLTTDGDVRGNWDQARLAQVVANLVGNAVVHGDLAAPIDVTISEELIVGGPALVSLAVTNRGPTSEAPEKLFEPFVQGERRGKGLGLGLYIARRIASSHGGTLDCISRDNATTFTLRLPRA